MSTNTIANRLGSVRSPRHGEAPSPFNQRAAQALTILKRPNLTQFQRGFLATMTTQRKLSPRQEEIWRELRAMEWL